MEDPVNIQDEFERKPGWKAQMASLFNSWVIFTLGCYFFVLRLLKEFFKSGAEITDDVQKASISVGGAVNLRSASEIKVEGIMENSAHTVNIPVLDIHSPPTPPSASVPLEQKPLEPSSEHSKNTLVIKNLPFKFKLADLEKLLSEHSAKVKNVRLLRDETGKFTGMAFLRCSTKEDAQSLISNMNDLDISGRNIQVEFKTKGKKKKKLNASSDSMSSSSSDWEERPAARMEELKPFRRKSTTDTTLHPLAPLHAVTALHPGTSYLHSAVSRIHAEKSMGLGIKPIRQPVGPDGKTNGFSAEYRRSRTISNK